MIVIGVAAAVTLCLVGGLAIAGGIVSGAVCIPSTNTPGSTASAHQPGARWNGEQIDNATTIVTVGQQRGVPPRGWVIALATAMQESGLAQPQARRPRLSRAVPAAA